MPQACTTRPFGNMLLESRGIDAGTVDPESTAKRRAERSTSAKSFCCRHGAICAGPAIRTVGLVRLSVSIKPAGRENVEQAGGGTDSKAELERVKSIEVSVRRQAEDAIVGPQSVLGAHRRALLR